MSVSPFAELSVMLFTCYARMTSVMLLSFSCAFLKNLVVDFCCDCYENKLWISNR